MNLDYLVTILVAVISALGTGGGLQLIFNRSGRKAEAGRQVAAREMEQVSRSLLLADAQAVAQKTALDSANAAYQQVRTECSECRAELVAVREAVEVLIGAIEEVAYPELTAGARTRLREAIRLARRAL